jgi:hypothetical protein
MQQTDTSSLRRTGAAATRLKLRVGGGPVRGWHVSLLRRLNERPGTIATLDAAPAQSAAALPPGVALLLRRHERRAGNAASTAIRAAAATALSPYRHPDGAPCDLALDLCGGTAPEAARVWHLTFDGEAGEAGLLRTLLAGRAPLAALMEGGATVAVGRLGTENGGELALAFEDVLARTITLILAALDGAAGAVPAMPGDAAPEAATAPNAAAASNPALRAARQTARLAVRQVYRALFVTPHWRVGWRRIEGPDLFDLRRHPDAGWRKLPDDRTRFYADPFPLLHEGRLTLFVEDFVHRLGRGIISAVAFGPDGPLGAPEPVLEEPYHLSYPFVFVRDGEVWMIPESCAAGTVDLYRAKNYPGGWVKEATLVSGLAASDATLIEHDGRWWMFATVRDGGGGAFSDTLHLWSAADFRGPWTPHPGNPVLIDIASARPAGRIVARDGALFRPVQDCRRGYGAALAIARITQLDDAGFSQSVESILTPGPLWPGRRLHTLNADGGFEFIDGSARVRRF